MKNLQFGETADKKMNWLEAQNWIASLNKNEYLGHTDWRLSERWELVKAYDDKVDGFKTDAYYWSSTTDVYYADLGVIVYFSNGYVGSYYKTNFYYVRPVRGEQCIGNFKEDLGL